MRPTLALYYATVTGNAESLARQAETRALNEDWLPRLQNLSELKPADLAGDRLALFIVSTWGDGEPPVDAADFWSDLAQSTPDLSGLHYAVLGLGDRDYAEFNAFARALDERLATLGAHRLHERIEADAYFDDTYAEWESRVFPLLAAHRAVDALAR
ncbi:MAG TPA: flavodoxin domain-containing protein [Opitutus sp.]|nr:flavodoxin domain-containing protein [Opitutus sp.]